ncbi:hypothetical protein AMECASPLE_009980, partial [Ameca splendens]
MMLEEWRDDAVVSRTPPPAPLGGLQGIPRPAERHSPSSVSWAVPWASSQWDVPGTPPEEGVQEASAQTPIEEFTPTPAFPALQYLESVDEGGVAWRAGLRMGDFLIEVNGQNVVKVGHRQVVNMIRQGGNSLMVKVVMVARNPELEDTARKKAPQQTKRLTPPAIALRSKSMTSELEDMGQTSLLLLPWRLKQMGKADGIINDEIPNCWECPKCHKEGKTSKDQADGSGKRRLDNGEVGRWKLTDDPPPKKKAPPSLEEAARGEGGHKRKKEKEQPLDSGPKKKVKGAHEKRLKK